MNTTFNEIAENVANAWGNGKYFTCKKVGKNFYESLTTSDELGKELKQTCTNKLAEEFGGNYSLLICCDKTEDAYKVKVYVTKI